MLLGKNKAVRNNEGQTHTGKSLESVTFFISPEDLCLKSLSQRNIERPIDCTFDRILVVSKI